MNGVDAYRLKLLLPMTQQRQDELAAQQLAELQLSGNDASIADERENMQHSAAEITEKANTAHAQSDIQSTSEDVRHHMSNTAKSGYRSHHDPKQIPLQHAC